ncbi:MAG: family 43 glycosylhydrolase [Chitinivibrionales bacterium]|nr:family 43 glycosylhydrolase [Chitinivibrionales bacterium]
MHSYRNPILPGFYPDPSLCRVGRDFYLVTSSFEYFPGVPIFTSKDLVNWKQIGHVLDRPSQLDLDNSPCSRGIWAPTIRFHDGVFYMCTTNMLRKPRGESDVGGHFIVTATDPAGPWSEPYRLDDAPGIDPSLFFDDDGKAYFMATCYPHQGSQYKGNNEIWCREMDIQEMRLIGERYYLWQGALDGAALHTEAPHIYTINGWYYLMVAEGGTGYKHSVTIARSKSVTGPYENNPRNPLITHRNMGNNYPITNVGHADLVQTQNGEWWMVLLGSRPYGGLFRNLGRETFLVRVVWENGWPIVSPGCGRVEFEHAVPDLEPHPWNRVYSRDNFDAERLDFCWNFLRTPRESFWSLSERTGCLRLKLRPEKLSECVNPSFIGRRQQHMNFSASCAIEFDPAREFETAGLVLLQNNNFHFRLEVGFRDGRRIVMLTKREAGDEQVLSCKEIDSTILVLTASARGQEYGFYYGSDETAKIPLAEKVDGRVLSTEIAGGFTGIYIGMYASSNGAQSGNHADFHWFEYRGEEG